LVADQANELIVDANSAIIANNANSAVEKVTDLAKIIFEIDPFAPKELPVGWEAILSAWLHGDAMADIGGDDRNQVLNFVEEGLVYKLPWGIEALRVRAEANLDVIGDPMMAMTIQDFDVGHLAPALETGTLNRSAAILIQAGFSSRTASLKIIANTNATFENATELARWLCSEEITVLTDNPDWPTRETRNLWLEFQQSYSPTINKIWTKQTLDCQVNWNEGIQNAAPNQPFRIEIGESDSLLVMSPAMEPLGQLVGSFTGTSIGLVRGRSLGVGDELRLEYFGPSRLICTYPTGKYVSAVEFGRYLRKVFPSIKTTASGTFLHRGADGVERKRSTRYTFPPLPTARRQIEAHMGQKIPWTQELPDWEDRVLDNRVEGDTPF
jgi:hypothetical protein